MENEIIIQVIGRAATGKSALSQEIVDLLRGLRFNVEWDTSPDKHDENGARKQPSTQNERLDKIRQKEPKIIVKEVQAIRKL